MNYVYILQSEVNSRFYVGSTTDFPKRMKEHAGGLVLSTKAYKPWKVAFKKEFESYSEARKAELKIKRYKRRDYIIRIIATGSLI
jgi:putative endonuclease